MPAAPYVVSVVVNTLYSQLDPIARADPRCRPLASAPDGPSLIRARPDLGQGTPGPRTDTSQLQTAYITGPGASAGTGGPGVNVQRPEWSDSVSEFPEL